MAEEHGLAWRKAANAYQHISRAIAKGADMAVAVASHRAGGRGGSERHLIMASA